MALSLPSHWLSRSSATQSKISAISRTYNNALVILLISRYTSSTSSCAARLKKSCRSKACSGEGGDETAEKSVLQVLGEDDDELLSRVSGAKDAEGVLEIIAEKSQRSGGVVGVSDCCSIITAALERSNAQLAFSVYSAMNSSFDQGVVEASSVGRWKWARPNLQVYSSLVCGLAASLRVSDAIRTINDVCQVGVSSGDEVPFGKVVRCPSCMIAISVAQPQHGIQVVSCSKCRYQYELFSGDIVSIESEEIRETK